MRKVKIVLLSIITAVLMMSTSITVFAATDSVDDAQAYIDQYGTSKISSYLYFNAPDGMTTVQVWVPNSTSASKVQQNLDITAYSKIDEDIANRANANAAQQDTLNQLQNINDGLNLQPDINGAMGSISGFVPAINFVLGLLVSIISAGMTILTALDICYIVFPVVRGKCENMKQNGTATSKGRSEKAGETRLAFISDEAEYSINAAETTQTGKNPLVIYFQKRAFALIILAVVIFMLLTGNINLITNIAIKGVSGILKIIQDIAA